MTVFQDYKKVVEVSKDHPELIAEIDEFLEKGRNVPWITGRLNLDLRTLGRPTLKPSELAGFLRHRRLLNEKQQKLRKVKGMSRAKKNHAATGDGTAVANSGLSQGTPDSQETVGAVNEEFSVLSEHTRQQRAAEKKRTHEEIVDWAHKVVRDLFLEARTDPNTDAGKMMFILLTERVVAMEERLVEADIGKLMDEQRRRQQAEMDKEKLEMERVRTVNDTRYMKEKARNLQIRNKELEGKLDMVKEQIGTSRVLTPADIYDKISAVIGMGDVVVPRVEKQAPPVV